MPLAAACGQDGCTDSVVRVSDNMFSFRHDLNTEGPIAQ
jgi:hypothetical protein